MNNFKKLCEAVLKNKTQKIDSLVSYSSDKRTSKMWILPDGKVVALKGMWHYDWILRNKAALKKKYKVDFSKLPAEEAPIRLHAINKGFFRVNYEHNGGVLTVEGVASFFTRKIKDAIFFIVLENVDYIDNINITLMNSSGKVVKDGYAQMFMMSNEEKMDNIPLVTESLKKILGEGYYTPPKSYKKDGYKFL